MIIAIGNPPSSGSTYLADLLDSLPFAVCGPEVNLFSAKDYFTQFNKIKKKGFFSSQSPAVYQSRQKLLEDRLCSWGIDRILLRHILSNTISYKDFCHKLFNVFADIRGKKCKLFFEKTPQNIHCARQFLDTFDEGIFLHIVRDPLNAVVPVQPLPPPTPQKRTVIEQREHLSVRRADSRPRAVRRIELAHSIPRPHPQRQHRITDDVYHYSWQVRVGPGPFDVVGLHRVVKERSPNRPIRTRKSVFMLHGDFKDFAGCFLPGLLILVLSKISKPPRSDTNFLLCRSSAF